MSTRDQTDLRRASLRLALRFGTLILIIFAVLLTVTYFIVQSSQRDETTHILMDASQAASVQSAPQDVLVARDDHGQMTVSPGAPSWFPDASQLAAAATRDDPLQTTRTVGGKTYTIVTISHDGMSVQAAQDDTENQGELRRLALALIISGFLGSIASGLVAAIIARRALRPMVDALSLQRRFVTDASHELRTPLTLLTTRTQLLRREAAKSPAAVGRALASGLDDILQDSRELTGILEDLLIAADPRETAERVPLDLTKLARDVVASLSVHAKDRHIALHGPVSDEPIMVDGSRASILRLFTSLVSNALDHARSEVRVEVHSAGRGAEITVRDDGRGFPDDMRERAFERFATSRAGHDHDAQTRHYGLGLALVAEIAFRHDGSVRVEPTESGSGAVIVVTLPLSILK